WSHTDLQRRMSWQSAPSRGWQLWDGQSGRLEGLPDRLKQFRFRCQAVKPLDLLSRAVENQSHRKGFQLVLFGESWPGDADRILHRVFGQEGLDQFGAFLIHADTNHTQPLRRVLLLQLIEGRNLANTGYAIGCPEINDDDLAGGLRSGPLHGCESR